MKISAVRLAVISCLTIQSSALLAEQNLEHIEVTGKRTPLYDTRDVNAAALGIKDVLMLPISIQSFSDALIVNQRSKTLGDILANDASVQNTSIGAVFDFVSLRGFQLDWTNGLRRDGLALAPFQDVPLENIQRIDVLKGPSGIIAGFNNPGGTINYVTKRPTAKPFAEITAEVKSRDGKYLHLDLSNTLKNNANLGYRVNLAVEDNGDFTGGDDLTRYFASAAIDIAPSDNSILRLDADFQDKKIAAQPILGLAYVDDKPVLPPYVDMSDVLLGQPWAKYETQTTNLGLRYDYWLNDNWQWINQIAYSKNDRFTIFPDIYQVDLEGKVLSSDILVTPDESYRSVSAHSFVSGTVFLGELENELVVGASIRDYQSEDGRWFNVNNPVGHIFHPIHTKKPKYPQYPQATKTDTREISYFVTNTMQFSEEFFATLGLRHIRYEKQQQQPNANWQTLDDRSFNTPIIGFNYKLDDSSAFYLSYSEGAGEGGVAVIGSGAINEGDSLGPQESEQLELGFKMQLDGASVSLAVFEIEKMLEYHNHQTNYFTQDGKQVHQGIEANINGQVHDNLSIVASATYMDAKLEDLVGDATLNGNRPANVAKYQGNVFLDYQLSAIEGLSANLGLYYVGNREQNINNTLSLPSYSKVDLGAKYEIPQHGGTVRVKVENLFDKEYWSSAGAKGIDWGVMPGRGRTVIASYTYSF
ncbi:TonB-dependent siderophore receptor [Thalassotalea marina]|uniref:Ligand-gated channel n=1 Tax=Thalassotalea marina TaxID=1673741 RepID=A0A919BG24_9GAMM|nr:TonB-dependent receptor [Thalassotalea marina]GHF89125.1 ligand-gated channel [Thalassotalea marina]